jgi:hypothetical protein
MQSERAALAERVLKALMEGATVVVADALQLRAWAETPEDALLPLRDLASRILNIERRRKPISEQE